MQNKAIYAWTDYPILALGDKAGELAPIRKCLLLLYDGNKYCRIYVNGVLEDVKNGYLYSKPGRYGKVPYISKKILTILYNRKQNLISFDEKLENLKNSAIMCCDKLIKNGMEITDKAFFIYFDGTKWDCNGKYCCPLAAICLVSQMRYTSGSDNPVVNNVAEFFSLKEKDIQNFIYGFDNFKPKKRHRSKAYKLGQELRKKYIKE